VEEQVAAIDLICALSAHDHLETPGLDLPCQNVHWYRRSDLQHIVTRQIKLVCFVKEQASAIKFICALSAHDYLESSGLYLS